MEALGIAVDLAHASPRTVEDALALATRPVVVSHTGVQGTCPGPRNLSDEQLRRVAAQGGVVGIGYFPGAVCGSEVADVVRAALHARRGGGGRRRRLRLRLGRRDHDSLRRRGPRAPQRGAARRRDVRGRSPRDRRRERAPRAAGDSPRVSAGSPGPPTRRPPRAPGARGHRRRRARPDAARHPLGPPQPRVLERRRSVAEQAAPRGSRLAPGQPQVPVPAVVAEPRALRAVAARRRRGGRARSRLLPAPSGRVLRRIRSAT